MFGSDNKNPPNQAEPLPAGGSGNPPTPMIKNLQPQNPDSPTPGPPPVDPSPPLSNTVDQPSQATNPDMSEQSVSSDNQPTQTFPGGIRYVQPPSQDTNRASSDTSAKKSNEDELLQIKQQALQNLAPLVDKLEQKPEERFETLLMMIQASDNPEFLDEAYAAANSIADEKSRAHALLDVVNEINYFTKKSLESSNN